MNILYIHTHDSGRYWQPWGHAIPMPCVTALTEDSVVFRQAYCAAPTCSPSRAALVTGMAAHCTGMLGLAHRGFSLYNKKQTIASWFSAHGYETALCGVQHEALYDDELDYDVVLPFSPWLGVHQDQIAWDSRNAQTVCDYLRRPHDKPFFLSYGMVNTHRPYPNHSIMGVEPNRVKVPSTVPDTPENREDMADYHCAAMAVDRCVGQVIDALKEAGRYEDTIILLTTDHGIAWPFMKCSLYDAGIGVAMMLRWPGMTAPGVHRDQLVSQVDVFPTLCELAGVPKPQWLQGVSLLPAAEKGEEVRSAVFAEVNYHAAWEPMRCIRTTKYKLIVRYDDYQGVVAPNIDASAAKDALREAGYMDTALPRLELYDLTIDPAERHNLSNDPRYTSICCELKNRLEQWMRETDDPLLNYRFRIPAPQGAKVNCRDGYDPEDCAFETAADL